MHSAKFFFFSQVTEQILLINLFFFSPNVLENKSLQYKVWVKLGDIFRLIELNWFLDRCFEHMKRLSILWISILMWLKDVSIPRVRGNRSWLLKVPVVSCVLTAASGHLCTYTRTLLISSDEWATIVTSDDPRRYSYFPDVFVVFLS